jgi:hypothetical protein
VLPSSFWCPLDRIFLFLTISFTIQLGIFFFFWLIHFITRSLSGHGMFLQAESDFPSYLFLCRSDFRRNFACSQTRSVLFGQNRGPNRILSAPKPRLTVCQMTERSLISENRISTKPEEPNRSVRCNRMPRPSPPPTSRFPGNKPALLSSKKCIHARALHARTS